MKTRGFGRAFLFLVELMYVGIARAPARAKRGRNNFSPTRKRWDSAQNMFQARFSGRHNLSHSG
jgi:hypothetical protein